MLLMLGLQSFTIAIITLMLKRFERRLIRLFMRDQDPPNDKILFQRRGITDSKIK
jgi:hypothetical protein